MTVQVSAIGRLGVCTEGTFNTAEVVGSFLDLPVVEGSVALAGMQDHLEPEVMQQFAHAYTDSKMVLGKLSATLAFTTYLAGTGAPQNGNLSWLTTAWAQYALLKTLLGGVAQGTAAHGAATLVVAAGSTSTSINVTAGHGTNAVVGGAFACLISGKYEAREILSVSTDTIVPKVAFSAAPANGAAVLWATTFHMVEGASANLASLQFLCEGMESGDEYTLYGGQGTLAIDVATGAIAKMSAQIQGASWARSALRTIAAPTSIPGFSPIANVTGELIVGSGAAGISFTNGTAQVRNVVSHSQSTWTPGFAVAPITSPEGLLSSNIIGYKRARGRAVTGSFVTYGDDNNATATWLGADAGRYDYSINQQIGMSASSMVLLCAPTVQISAAPTRTDAGGLYGLTVNWAGRNDSAISVSTDIGRSAFRVHVF